jgi:hypothetical protein
MSIRLPNFSKIIPLFFLFLLTNLALINNTCFAWDGYDYQNNAAIEIGSGNLVREGSIIKIYDWKKDEYHNVEIKMIDGNFSGTKMEVYDFDDKKIRFFEMNAQ